MKSLQTEEEIQAALAGEAIKGPRFWQGAELAPLTRGLRDLRNKVIAPDDTATFHDVTLLYLLREAHDPDASRRLEKRRKLLIDTDDVPTFRASMSLLLDEIESIEGLEEVSRLAREILGLVELAQVVQAEKKSDAGDPAAPNLTTMPSTSGSSRKKRGGAPTTSAGS